MRSSLRTAVMAVAAGSLTFAAAAAAGLYQPDAPTPTETYAGHDLPVTRANNNGDSFQTPRVYIADGGSTARIVKPPAGGALLSPDGTLVAYSTRSPFAGRGAGNVMIGRTDGSAVYRVLKGPLAQAVAWSPDGRSLLAQRSRDHFRVLTVAANGRVTRRRAGPTLNGMRSPTFVWAGAKTLISAGTIGKSGSRFALVRANINGGRPTTLMRRGVVPVDALADGSILLMDPAGFSDADAKRSLWVVRRPGGRELPLGASFALGLTARGTVIALRNPRGLAEPDAASRLIEVDPQRQTSKVLMKGVDLASVSADHRTIAVRRAVRAPELPGGRWIISTVGVDGTVIRDLAVAGDTRGTPLTLAATKNRYLSMRLSPSGDGGSAVIDSSALVANGGD